MWQLAPGRNLAALVKTPFREWGTQMSPDGQWIAYNSNETGQPEVFVRSFPPSGDAIRVSNTGGIGPRWRGDGKELFFIDASRRMMAVEVPLQPNLDRHEPQALFELPMMRRRHVPRVIDFDVSSDGQRFLLVRIPPDTGRRPLTLLQNWTAGVKR